MAFVIFNALNRKPFIMKYILAAGLAISIAALNPVKAQTGNTPSEKKASVAKKDERPSPPMSASGTIGDLKVNVAYSAPGVKGRSIWGELVPYGKVWRTGANEATTVEVSRDCKVGGGMLRAGKYALFSIPGENEWTIIFNSAPDQWGAYKYDESKDALRFKVKPAKSPSFNERFKIEVVSDPIGNGMMHLYWENLMVSWEIR